MNEETQKRIGTILDKTAERDAVHIAVAPLIAGTDLYRGHDVGLAWGTTDVALMRDKVYGCNPIGIVDPFLKDYMVKKGQMFYCWLYPNSVTGMRHHWQHPAFDGPPPKPKNEAEKWLREFADKWNFDYDQMVAASQEEDGSGYVVARGIDLHDASELAEGDEAKFWQCIESLTGSQFSQEHRKQFTWSCSC